MEAISREVRAGKLTACCEIVCVFSNNPDSAGIPVAAEMGFPVKIISSKGKKRRDFDTEVVDFLRELKVDYIVLAGYMRLLSPVLISAYPGKIINIHPADTAAFQGVGGYEWAWENKLRETFITVHYVDEGMDTGDVIAQRKVDLADAGSFDEVKRRGLAVEHEFFSDVLKDLFIKD